ncbi:MAG: hypothetical protein QMD14_05965 [Candidatus Aenigmarchaeota archaeon]|nr:hypothetical protein [Candidatus Aenigmarchaeota archaeon]
MHGKAIVTYKLFIILLIAFIVIFALMMVRMFTEHADCLTKQQICSTEILAFCAAWYGEDKSFDDPQPEPRWNKIPNCVMMEGKANFLNFCLIYEGKEKPTGRAECKKDEWKDCCKEADKYWYCTPNKTFCEELLEVAKKELEE